MTVNVKLRTNICRLSFGVALLWVLGGCFGPPVYRPAKAHNTSEPVKTVAVTNSHLPPEPDPKLNKATLPGIDTTGTGMRDDVYIWIYRNYSSPAKRASLTRMAKDLQSAVAATPKTPEDARRLERSYRDSLSALQAVPNIGAHEADAMDRSLYLLTVDTENRLKAFLQYDLLLGAGKAKGAR